MLEESGDVLIQDIPVQVEMVIINAPLAADGAHVDVVEPWPSDVIRGDDSTPVCP
jgi:hypothetical protein